jgi:DNA replication and repair protein RecF
MRLNHLSLTNYRAFTRLDMELPRRILLLVGGNAQGKTSLLEAIYYLATFNSFLTQNDREMINFHAQHENPAVTRLIGDFQRGEKKHRLEVRLIQEMNGEGGTRLRKEILLDGVRRNSHEAMGQFTAVIFLPHMTRIIEGGPDERRRYLNLALSQAVQGYYLALSEYTQVVTQRNALLKQLGERNGDLEELLYWDTLLVERGTFLIRSRISAIYELEQIAARIHARLTHSREVFRLDYQPAFDPLNQPRGQFSLPLQTPVQRNGLSEEQIKEGFLARLRALRPEEIARGQTTIGPHRDELRFLSNGIDLCDYGSRGQVRTALISLKLAEDQWIKQRTGDYPVLLLDETLAELDNERRNDL